MAKTNGRRKTEQEEPLVLSEKEITERIKDKIQAILNKETKVIAKNESQKTLIRLIKAKEITICSGPAGSGKTFVSLALALGLLRNKNNHFRKIYLIKSVTTLKGEEIGFLKGDLSEKFEPFMMSFVINMEKMIEDSELKNLFECDIIRPFPLAYIRGASLDNCIIVADEMQNVSLDNARTLLTRVGQNSKLILLGDTNQIDLRNKEESSLEPILNMFKDVEEIGCVTMSEEDKNIRNPIITKIENKFKEHFSKDDIIVKPINGKNGRQTRTVKKV